MQAFKSGPSINGPVSASHKAVAGGCKAEGSVYTTMGGVNQRGCPGERKRTWVLYKPLSSPKRTGAGGKGSPDWAVGSLPGGLACKYCEYNREGAHSTWPRGWCAPHSPSLFSLFAPRLFCLKSRYLGGRGESLKRRKRRRWWWQKLG